MKSLLLFFYLVTIASLARAQQVDSIYFHLYTDSLKRGTYNYINVDGKRSNNTWLPLTAKEISFTASAGSFEGNSLFIENNFAGEKVSVKAVLKANPGLTIDTSIFIKKLPDSEKLLMPEAPGRQSRRHPGK